MYDIYKSPHANYLAIRFHAAVRLVTNKSHMTFITKRGTRDAAECVTDVLATF